MASETPALPLDGQVILVTGGSRGIGHAIGQALAAAGARVLRGSRSAPALPERPHLPEGASAGQLDVTDQASVAAAFDWLDRAAGRLDAVVLNAGVGVFRSVEALTLDEWRQVLETNLTGAFLCARESMRRMKRQGHGRIVAIGSLADRIAFTDCAAYGASKHGLRGLVGVLTEEGKAHGVFATLVSPGAVSTDIWSDRPGFDRADMLTPEDVARIAVQILSQPPRVRIDELTVLPPRGTL